MEPEELKNSKIYLGKHSRKIQEKLFKLGCKWKLGGSQFIDDIDRPFMYIREDLTLFTDSSLKMFNDDNFKEITFEELMCGKK